MRFFVSKLRRAKKHWKNDAEVAEKSHVFGPKRYAKIIEKSLSKKQRKNIPKWSQNGAQSGPITIKKSIENVM